MSGVKFLAIVVVALVIAGCTDVPDRKGRWVGSIWDPYCAPDGSIVLLHIPNSQGSYEGIKSRRELCPWNR